MQEGSGRRAHYDSPKPLLARMAAFLDNFGKSMSDLHGIAQKQLDHTALSEEEESFLKRVMEEERGSGSTRYLGWYPMLFYTRPEDSGIREVLVTDVHTDPADPNVGDPGCIVHEGVGDVHVMFVVADTSDQKDGERLDGGLCCYAGPVFSHYEFVAPAGTRLTNEQWKRVLDEGAACGISKPPQPVWTQPWLVAKEGERQREGRELAELLASELRRVELSQEARVSAG